MNVTSFVLDAGCGGSDTCNGSNNDGPCCTGSVFNLAKPDSRQGRVNEEFTYFQRFCKQLIAMLGAIGRGVFVGMLVGVLVGFRFHEPELLLVI